MIHGHLYVLGISMDAHIVFDVLANVWRELEPSLCVFPFCVGVFAGQVVLQLQAGCHARHIAVLRLHDYVGEGLQEAGQVGGGRLLQIRFGHRQFIFVCGWRVEGLDTGVSNGLFRNVGNKLHKWSPCRSLDYYVTVPCKSVCVRQAIF